MVDTTSAPPERRAAFATAPEAIRQTPHETLKGICIIVGLIVTLALMWIYVPDTYLPSAPHQPGTCEHPWCSFR